MDERLQLRGQLLAVDVEQFPGLHEQHEFVSTNRDGCLDWSVDVALGKHGANPVPKHSIQYDGTFSSDGPQCDQTRWKNVGGPTQARRTITRVS
jgi:hypothetical protein